MRKETPAANPDAYVAALGGWQAGCVAFHETVKWGHLVYFASGPAMLIRAEDERVLMGFWRGRRLTELEPSIETGGKCEMGPIVLRERDAIEGETVQRLAAAARRLNLELGDPTARA